MRARGIQFFILALLSAGTLKAEGSTHYGISLLQDFEKIHLEKNVHKIVKVNPNALAAQRSGGEPSSETEFTTIQTYTVNAARMMSSVGLLPSSVNNALLPSFPPIGDQGLLGSCVAWASTYYQASHEIGLLNEVDNQASSDGILSPKWTYDLLNNGTNAGLSPLSAFQLLASNGAVSITNFPYDSDYTGWDLNPEHWISAISNRMSNYMLIPGLGGLGAQNLSLIKQALANGHVLTFATFIDSWVIIPILEDPEDINNSYVGQGAVSYMNGTNGAHCMTIVGYDDSLWIDVNGNGQVDPGERGAFLIANSWGTGWGNNGFIWISYDAFLIKSKVIKGQSLNAGRVPAGNYFNSSVVCIVPKAKNYSPSLIAQFELNQSQRNNLKVQAGVSSILQTNATNTVAIDALSNRGGALAFDGTTSSVPENATFSFDLSDFLTSGLQTRGQRYYLTITDATGGSPTELLNYSLIDLTRMNQINNPNVPQTFSNSTGSLYLDYDFKAGRMPPQAILIASFPIRGERLSLNGVAQVTVTVLSNVGVTSVQLYLDSVLVGPMMSSGSSYVASVDTTILKNGAHQLKAIVTDRNGNQSECTAEATVKNVVPTVSFTSPMVNNTISSTVQVSVQAVDPSIISSVQLYVDSALIGVMENSGNSYTLSIDTKNFSNGIHKLKAVVTDTIGNQSQSLLNISIRNVVATVKFLFPAANATLSGTSQVTVRALDSISIVSIQIFLDATLIGSMKNLGVVHAISVNTNNFSNGAHALQVVVTDAQGNQVQNSMNINIQN